MAFRYTPTPTPSITPTISLTPSNTPSYTPTSSVCPGLTPTATETSTATPTITPTTSTCINCYEYSFTASTSGILSWLDCDGILSDTFVNSGDTYTITCPGARQGSPAGTGTLAQGSLCSSNCITPTPTPTVSLTPSITATNTPTMTNTPTTSPLVCLCYYIQNETASVLQYTYTPCGTGLPVTLSLTGGGITRVCSEVFPTGDPGMTIVACVSITNCTDDPDCAGCS